MLNFSAKPAPTYRQAEDASMRGLESLLIPDAPGVPEGEAYYPQTAESGDSRFSITQKNIQELGNTFKGIIDMHSQGMKQIDEDFADDPIAKNALKSLGYLSTGTNLAITAGFSPFTLGTAYLGDLVANITGDETTGRQLFRDLNTFLIGRGGEAPVTIKIPSKKGVVNATVNKDGSINVGEKTYGGDLNLNRAQFMDLVRRETFGSAGRETGNLNLMPLREDGLPSPTVQKTEIPKVKEVIKDIQTKAKDTAPDPKAKDLTLDNIDPKDVTDNSYNPAVLIPKFSTEKQTGDKVLNENKTAPALTKNFDASTAYGFPGQWWDFKTNQSLNNKSFMSGTITIDPETLLPSTQFNNEIKGNYDIKIQGRTKDPDLDGTVVTVNKLGGTKFKILESPNKDLIGKPLEDKQGLLAITRGNSARNKTAAGGGKFKITGTDHIYTMKFNSTTPIKLGSFPYVQDNPRLVGVTVDDIFVGDVGMTIQVGGSKGKIHPVYTEALTAPPGTYKKMEEAGFDPYKKENSIAEYQKYLESQSKPDEGKVLQFEKKEEAPRDESSGMAADYVPPQYGPPAFDLTQVVKEEFSPEGFSTFSTDVGSNYQRLDDFIYVRPSNDPIQTAIYKEQLNFIDSLKKIKGNPNAKVVMYRAAPTKELREGDLLTPSKTEAKFYVDESKITRDDIRKAERDRRLSEDVVDLQKEKNIKAIENIQDIFGEQKVTPSQLFKYELEAKDVRWDGGNRGMLGWGYFPSKDKTIYHPLDRVFKQQIREVLSTDLLSPQYLAKLEKDADISCGQCYAAAEAVYHKWGKFNGFTPKYLTSKDFPEGLPKGETHWFLQNKETKEIIDPTAEQFGGIPIPYEKGTGAGFLTKEPAKNKGKEVLNRLGTEKVIQTPSGVILDFANQKGIETEGAPLNDWLRTHNYDLEYNSPERKTFGDLKNTTGKDPRFLVGFTTKDGNQGYITGYGTEKNVGFVEYFANLGTKDKASGETPSPLKPSELKEIINELKKHYGFRQFAGDRITGIRKQNRDNQDSYFDRSQDLLAVTPKPKSAVDIMINPNFASIGKTGKIYLRDVFDFFDDVPTKRNLNNPVERKQMLNEAFDEIVYMKQQAVSGEGWYQQDVKKALKIVEKILPVVKERPILKDFLLFLTGISSALTPVGNDFKIGIQMIKSFAETGEIPLRNPFEPYNEKSSAVKQGLAKIGEPKKWNKNAQNLEKQITFVNNFIKDQGLDAFMKFLFKKTTRRDLAPLRKKYANMGPLSGKLDEKIFGFQNFGPKVGPFLANISGVTNLNVVDLWNSRSMNRLTGDMFIRDKDGKILSFADTPRTETERELWNGFMDELAEMANLSVDDTQAIRWYFEQLLYTYLGVKSEPKSYADVAKKFLEEAEKEANDSDGGVRQSDGSKNKPTVTKKAQGGSISIPQRRSLVNDGLVDINTIIGKINYGN